MRYPYTMVLLFFVLSQQSVFSQSYISSLLGDSVSVALPAVRGTVQWQYSTDSLQWVNTGEPNALALVYTGNLGQYWLRASIQEYDCPVLISEVVGVEVLPQPTVSHLVLLDTLPLILQQHQSGVYQFLCETTNTGLHAGDYIISTMGEGSLDVIDYSVLRNHQLTLHTHAASLADILGDATIQYSFDLDSLESPNQSWPMNIVAQNISAGAGSYIHCDVLQMAAQGVVSGEFVYSSTNGLQSWTHAMDAVHMDLNEVVNFTVNNNLNTTSGNTTIANFAQTKTFMADSIPVVFTLALGLDAEYNIAHDGPGTASFDEHAEIAFTSSQTWNNGQWTQDVQLSGANGFNAIESSGTCNSTFAFDLVPHLELRVFGVPVRSGNMRSFTSLQSFASATSSDWNMDADAHSALTLSEEDFSVLSSTVAGFDDLTFENGHNTISTPSQLELVSGGNQIGFANQSLAIPIVVRVTDSQGHPQFNVPLQIAASEGNAMDSVSTLITDANGLVQLQWSFGSIPFATHELVFSCYNANLNHIVGSPLVVQAFAEVGCGLLTSIVDVDGNVYPVVEIGNQCWTQTNLRTAHYNNGTEVVNMIPNSEWSAQWPDISPPGAWAVPNEVYEANFGKLYNWYATVNPAKLCPTGWHVPSDEEWNILENYLGGAAVAGGKMMTPGILSDGTGLWNVAVNNSTNESGFTALPARERDALGNYWYAYQNGAYFHTSTEAADQWPYGNFMWYRRMAAGNGPQIVRDYTNKQYGFSVRCLKD